jgi:hypothetical protein
MRASLGGGASLDLELQRHSRTARVREDGKLSLEVVLVILVLRVGDGDAELSPQDAFA